MATSVFHWNKHNLGRNKGSGQVIRIHRATNPTVGGGGGGGVMVGKKRNGGSTIFYNWRMGNVADLTKNTQGDVIPIKYH